VRARAGVNSTVHRGFATDGEPGWPAYDLERHLTRVFDIEPAVVPYPEEVSRRVWQGYVFAALPLLTRV
jgi:para-nitrobenzyl esterase